MFLKKGGEFKKQCSSVDPDTGERVIESVYRREEIYHGEQLELAADIVFIPTRLEYFGFGEYEFGSHKIIEAMERGISGTHRMNGVFLAYGAAVEPGSEVEGASLVDLAPTILDACGGKGGDIPTLCYGETITPKNACRVCMVEVEGSRVLVPSCSRAVEDGMVVTTRSERVDHARKMVLEFLGSSVDLSLTDRVDEWNDEYGADPGRYGDGAATVAQPVKVDNDLYVRDYAKCILCYKCVEACGDDAQHTFAIAVSGRGFDARISTEFDVRLPDSACVYCGNCVAVCPKEIPLTTSIARAGRATTVHSIKKWFDR